MTMFNNTAAPATSNGNEASGSGLTSGLTSAASGVGLAQQQLRNKKVPHIELGLTARKQALVDNIDAWAMWISPPIFLVFNLVYWVSFRHVV